jgi:hypothetical protein
MVDKWRIHGILMECNSSHDFIWFMYIIYDLIWRDYLFGINHNGLFREKASGWNMLKALQSKSCRPETPSIYILIYILYMINYISMENPFCFWWRWSAKWSFRVWWMFMDCQLSFWGHASRRKWAWVFTCLQRDRFKDASPPRFFLC